MRRALLLSGSLGAGHEVHAGACASSLARQGWSTQILDAMRLLGPRGGSAGGAGVRFLAAGRRPVGARYLPAPRGGGPPPPLTS